jgi:phage-related minor tail protein
MAAEFKINAQELIAKVEELIKEGNARRIIIKDDKGRTYIEIPVTVGVIGALFAPIVAAVGALAGLAANFTIEVIKKDDEESSQKSE